MKKVAFLVVMSALISSSLLGEGTALAASGSKIMDNDPAVGTAKSDVMPNGIVAYTYVVNSPYSYSKDHRIINAPYNDYKYTWHMNVTTPTMVNFGLRAYLNNNSFTNGEAMYYFNGQPFAWIDQNTAPGGFVRVNHYSGMWVGSAISTVSVSSRDTSGNKGKTGADAIELIWF